MAKIWLAILSLSLKSCVELGCSSVVEPLPSMYVALGLSLALRGKKSHV
jgi:hypothetical protein